MMPLTDQMKHTLIKITYFSGFKNLIFDNVSAQLNNT